MLSYSSSTIHHSLCVCDCGSPVQGILSHQSTIDERVNLIMTRKRPNF